MDVEGHNLMVFLYNLELIDDREFIEYLEIANEINLIEIV